MLLEKDFSAIIYDVTNDSFEQVGMLNKVTSVMGSDVYVGCGSFKVWTPIDGESNDLLQKGRFIWFGGDAAGKIESIKKTIDDNGEAKIEAGGRTLECLIESRIVWDTFQVDGMEASTAIMKVVKDNCISPKDSKRKIPWLVAGDDIVAGGKITVQQTGGSVYEAIEDIASAAGLGFDVKFDPYNKKLVFEVTNGVDRTASQAANDAVVFTTDLEDILSSEYSLSTQDYRNVAVVDGEGEGKDRKRATAGNLSSTGMNRFELYVDARDVQSTYTDEAGEERTLTASQYTDSLVQRGNEKLSVQVEYEALESKVRVDDRVQYKYGEDYFVGDIVTVVDERLLCSIDVQITEAEGSDGEEYELVLTFGDQKLTMTNKVRKGIV